jgi:hypothetical protein
MLRCLPDGYDPDDCIGLGMRNDHNTTLEQTHGNKPGLAIIKPVIQDRDRLARKHPFDPNEVDSMLLNVGLPFRFIPFISPSTV